MKRESSGPVLSAVFVDYDNIYMSLRRKSEDAAERFAKDAGLWLGEIDSGALITPTNSVFGDVKRRLVMNRCYGNPVPRRNSNDNSTDMNSFPFVRHHFLRAGFEIVDCPPLTAQLKNSSDIRMVMDVRDFLTHDTYFDEFVILSGDADFTPVLHRLRAHARRTVIFANDYTAAPYTAICDGEVREADLIRLLLEGKLTEGTASAAALNSQADLDQLKAEIIAGVAAQVRAALQPVPLEALAERAMRALGHDRTVGTNWGGAGSFRELLAQGLPRDVALTHDAPYLAYVAAARAPALPQPAHTAAAPQHAELAPAQRLESQAEMPAERPMARSAPPARVPIASPPALQAPLQPPPAFAPPAAFADAAPMAPASRMPLQREMMAAPAPAAPPRGRSPLLETQPAFHAEPAMPSPQTQPAYMPPAAPLPKAAASPPPQPSRQPPPVPAPPAANAALQQSITRIQEASQVPTLSPKDYRTLFEVMAQEITEQGLQGAQTLVNIQTRATERGVQLSRDDARFVLEVVGEPDPWFEQGASTSLFAGRFRNFVVARCRSQGLTLSAEELDLIEAWISGGAPPQQAAVSRATRPLANPAEPAPQPSRAPAPDLRSDNWWASEPQRPAAAPASTRMQAGGSEPPALSVQPDSDEFPRIVRTRVRG